MKKDELLRKTILVCLGLIMTVMSIKADYLPFRKIDVSNGLLSNQPWAIHQLADHTFLIAYPYSFASFDGAQSHICRLDARDTYYINGYEARTLQDKMGRIWMKNYTSLLVYEPMSKTIVSGILNILSGSGVKKSMISCSIARGMRGFILMEKYTFMIGSIRLPLYILLVERK